MVNVRIIIVQGMECIHTQTGPQFILSSKGVEGCHPCGSAGKSLAHQSGPGRSRFTGRRISIAERGGKKSESQTNLAILLLTQQQRHSAVEKF